MSSRNLSLAFGNQNRLHHLKIGAALFGMVAISLGINFLSSLSYESQVRMASYGAERETVGIEGGLPSNYQENFSAPIVADLVIGTDLRSGLVERGASGYFGYLVEVVEAATKNRDFKARLVALPTLRSRIEIQAGREMAAFEIASEWRNGFNKEPLIELPISLYLKNGTNFSYSNIESIQGLRIGIVDGDEYCAEVSQLLDSMHESDAPVFRAKGENAFEQLIDSLLLDRVEGVLASSHVFEKSVATLGVDMKTFVRFDDDAFGSWKVFLSYSENEHSGPAYEMSRMLDSWLSSAEAKTEAIRLRSNFGF